MTNSRILDLFCGGGGSAKGYHDAGFEVIGVDIEPQPHYPYRFHEIDALDLMMEMLRDRAVCGFLLEDLDAIHASPPCQRWAQATLSQRQAGREYPDLITPLRPLLEATGLPWVLENVPQAPIRGDVRLCGCMFGLEIPEGQLLRERWFETSWGPPETGTAGSVTYHDHHAPSISIAGHGTPSWQRKLTGHVPLAKWRQVMGISWMNRAELTEAIPPAYTRFVGTLLREVLSEQDPAHRAARGNPADLGERQAESLRESEAHQGDQGGDGEDSRGP